MSFGLLALTPRGTGLETQVDALYAPGKNGILGILPGHTNYVASLKEAGVLKTISNGVIKYYALFGGSIEVRKGDLVVILTQDLLEAGSEEAAKSLLSKARNYASTMEIKVDAAKGEIGKELTDEHKGDND